ncbi:MAG TPA: YceI family protein [Parasegetibacter sp.]
MRSTYLFLALMIACGSLFAQKKTTTSATVSFDASTPIDALPKADNQTVIAALDTKTGDVQFEATVKNFTFSNPNIQNHFNGERRMNSDKYPKFTFKGKINDMKKVDFSKNGTYEVTVTGDLTVKDTSKTITVPATLVVKDGVINASSTFTIVLADFGVAADGNKVRKEPEIKVLAEFK